MLADLYQEFSHAPTPPPEIRSQFLAHLNKAHAAILREPGLDRLRSTLASLTFTSEADRAIYGVPAAILRVAAVTERDSDRPLALRDLAWLRETDPGLSAAGTPWAAIPLGYKPVARPPASTGLWVASSSALDSTQTVYVNGVRASGLPAGDVLAHLAGTSRVAIGTITNYVEVTSVVLNASGAGTIALYDAATGGHLLAEVPVGAIEPKYFCLQLHPTPSAAVTYYVDGVLPIVPLGDRDTPMLPEEFHDLLIAYARSREYEYKGDSLRFQAASREYQTGLSRLKTYVNSQPAQTYVLGQPRRAAIAREGPWYPATW